MSRGSRAEAHRDAVTVYIILISTYYFNMVKPLARINRHSNRCENFPRLIIFITFQTLGKYPVVGERGQKMVGKSPPSSPPPFQCGRTVFSSDYIITDFGFFLFFGFCFADTPPSDGLKNVSIAVPTAVTVGKTVTMKCLYDLEGEPLYMVKWYRGRQEFYRYVPKELPNTRVFPIPGVNVDVSDISVIFYLNFG